MIYPEQSIEGAKVWYEPSPGVRFLCVVESTTPSDYLRLGFANRGAKVSYSVWKGRGRSNYYDHIDAAARGAVFLADPPAAPEPVCIADELCTGCQTFVCDKCRKLRPACCGCGDDYPDSCNECVAKIHAANKGHEICPGCKAEVDPDTCSCGGEKPKSGYCDNHGFIAMGCQCMTSREPLAQLCTCGCPAIQHSSSDCQNLAHEEHRYRRAQ